VIPPYLVFCTDFQLNSDYCHFCHEADVLLGTLGNAVREHQLTAKEARRIWEPYKALYPAMYEEDDEDFPDIENSGMDFMPATELFVEAACAADVPGVGIPRDITPMSGVILEITDQAALDELQEKLGERYRIVVRDDGDYMFPNTVDAAQALIASARQTESTSPSTTEAKENDHQESRGTLKEYADRLAKEMLDSLNKHAGEHEDGRWNSAPSSSETV